MKLFNTLIQINNANAQISKVSNVLNTEIEISVWGVIGIVVGAAALGLGLCWLAHWWFVER